MPFKAASTETLDVDRLFVRDSSTPDGKSKSQLVDQIRNVVRDVDHALLVVGGGRSEESQVVSQWVDGPTDGDDQSQGVERGLAGLVSRASTDLGALTSEHFVAESQPAKDTWDEAAQHGDDSGLTGIPASQHEDGLSEKSVEESGAQVGHDSLEDKVELNNLKRHGDEPIGVSVHCWRLLSQHPGFTHVTVVPERNTGHETSNRNGCLPLLWDGCPFTEEEY